MFHAKKKKKKHYQKIYNTSFGRLEHNNCSNDSNLRTDNSAESNYYVGRYFLFLRETTLKIETEIFRNSRGVK